MNHNTKQDAIALQPGQAYYDHTKGRIDTIPDLTLQQYFMAAAKPPKVIFEPVIRNSYVRNRTGGHWEIPDFGTPEYKEMIEQLAQADAWYRIVFAERAIIAFNESKAPNQ